MEAMWMRTNPAIRRIAELVADGAIGEVRHITADFGLAGPFPPGTGCGRPSSAAAHCSTSASTR
jgi:predicted dehydrogenase